MQLVEPPPHSPEIEGTDRRTSTHLIEMTATANRTLIARNSALVRELEICAKDFDELAGIIEKFVGVASASEVRDMALRVRNRLFRAPEPIVQLAEIG